jgi:hypothetical protein
MRVLARWWAALRRRGAKAPLGYGDEVLFAEWVSVPVRAPQRRKSPGAR